MHSYGGIWGLENDQIYGKYLVYIPITHEQDHASGTRPCELSLR